MNVRDKASNLPDQVKEAVSQAVGFFNELLPGDKDQAQLKSMITYREALVRVFQVGCDDLHNRLAGLKDQEKKAADKPEPAKEPITKKVEGAVKSAVEVVEGVAVKAEKIVSSDKAREDAAKVAPAVKAPAKKAPAKTAPAVKAPAKETPAKEPITKKVEEAVESAVEVVEAVAVKAEKIVSSDKPQEDAAEKAPAVKAPAKKAPAKKAPAKKAPAKKAPAKETATKPAPVAPAFAKKVAPGTDTNPGTQPTEPSK